MEQALEEKQPGRALPDAKLGLAEQVARDARTRIIAAAGVVLVHAAYPPGHPALATLTPGVQRLAAVAFRLAVSFPVDTFVLLSFMNLAPRVRAGAGAGPLFRALARRLAPAHLFWTTAYLGTRVLVDRTVPSPGAIAEAIVLGTAASHLYFVPLLLVLTAAAPVLALLARTGRRAVVSGVTLAVSAAALHAAVGGGTPWSRAGIGILGYSPFALAGLALARTWGGVAPGPDRSGRTVRAAAAVTLASAGAIALATLGGPAATPALGTIGWLGGNGYALGVPVMLLGMRGPASTRVIRLARYTLGVYLVHPFFVQALRAVEARVAALAELRPLLVAPNAVLTCALSLSAVALLARTPLRRVVV